MQKHFQITIFRSKVKKEKKKTLDKKRKLYRCLKLCKRVQRIGSQSKEKA